MIKLPMDFKGKGGKPEKRIYALDAAEKAAVISRLKDDGVKESTISQGRFKGLGEMNADQLKETTMDVNTRRLLQIHLDINAMQATTDWFSLLMKKKESGWRRRLMEQFGHLVEADI